MLVARGIPPGFDITRIPREDALWAAWSRAVAPVYASEFVYEDNVLPDHAGETYRGIDGMRRAWATLTEPFDEMIYDLVRVVGSGDRLVSIYRVRTKARHSGVVQDFCIAYVWSFHGGRIVHQRGFLDAAEAVRASELEE